MIRRRRQRYAPPDGLDWRDPNMPVLRPWEFPDGTRGIREVPPDEEKAHCAYMVKAGGGIHYSKDPTYKPFRRRRRRIK